MVERHLVRCHSRDNDDPERSIAAIGGVNPAGSRWRVSAQQAIAGLDSGRWEFFIRFNGRDVLLTTRKHEDGSRSLMTRADGFPPHSLLNLLPICPPPGAPAAATMAHPR
jgi:hypothetical protein